jgi:hypothetical protein
MSFDLRNKIENYILSDFKYKMEEVISFCESPIEEKLLLELLNYFISHKVNGLEEYNPISFVEDWIFLHDKNFVADEEDKSLYNEHIIKHKYRIKNSFFSKFIGFKTTKFFNETPNLQIKKPINVAGIKYGGITQEIEVYPQYETVIDEKKYRIDIAIILNRKKGDQILETMKIGLECDGYDYHSSPIQKKNDDIRLRKLKTNGWREIFRYSGKEINSLKEKDIVLVFEEILKMFYC